ncbi:choice-of-anchor W domain-containing protein [Sandaracinobacteroides saxicola]|uniref:PEP-CTERM sorting domain-containing protein n=1 Tax=Sandaracinobacteroides saxicola TaxID=2759707 RepID=A0A7G5ILT0_9SPHN|nr:choice-of-anchor W domain-containing protein [Sandaracinobacteroides saxicola]QMW24322.1 PEP-CTERM sorting domain-containing protein [Sandaracinobacteroides saxicola]
MAPVAMVVAAMPAQAAVTLSYSGNNDAAFELGGGYLAVTRGLPTVNNNALVPTERAVGQVRIGGNSYTRGLHVPNASSGEPVPVGTGVVNALTNYAPLGGGSTLPWVNGSPVEFSIVRTGTTVTYSLGVGPGATTWSSTKGYYGDINAFVLRARSGTNGGIALSDLSYSDLMTTNQALASLSATNATAINLYEGVVGDFRLAGKATLSWTGQRPNGSNIAAQIKLIEMPVSAIPEPATWAMMIIGFGAVGVSLRRKGARATA